MAFLVGVDSRCVGQDQSPEFVVEADIHNRSHGQHIFVRDGHKVMEFNENFVVFVGKVLEKS